MNKQPTPLERAIAQRAQTATALDSATRQRRELDTSMNRLAGGLASLDILIAALQADEKQQPPEKPDAPDAAVNPPGPVTPAAPATAATR